MTERPPSGAAVLRSRAGRADPGRRPVAGPHDRPGKCVPRTHTPPLVPALLSWLMSSPADTGARPFDTDLTGRTAHGDRRRQRDRRRVRRTPGRRRGPRDRGRPGRGRPRRAGPRHRHRAPALRPGRPRRASAPCPSAVDILVNNAGIQHVAPIQDFPPERFDLILRLMLQSPFRLVRAGAPAHVRRRLGPGRQRLQRARAAGQPVQVGVRHGQARPRGTEQGDRAGGRRRTASPATA